MGKIPAGTKAQVTLKRASNPNFGAALTILLVGHECGACKEMWADKSFRAHLALLAAEFIQEHYRVEKIKGR